MVATARRDAAIDNTWLPCWVPLVISYISRCLRFELTLEHTIQGGFSPLRT